MRWFGVLLVCQINRLSVQANSTLFSGGTGSKNDPYLISSPQDFETLRQTVDAGNRYKDQYFELTNSIDFKGYDHDNNNQNGNFAPIGSPSYPFSGHIDGQGYTISNVELSGTETYLSFIGALHGGSLKNIQLEGFKIQGTTVYKNLQYLSALVGEVSNAELINISVNNATLYSQEDRGDRYLSVIAADIYGSRFENIVTQNSHLSGFASACGVGYYSDDGSSFKNILFNSTIEVTYYKDPFVCYADNNQFENIYWNKDRVQNPDVMPEGSFKNEDIQQGRLPEILEGFDLKNDWVFKDGILQLIPSDSRQTIQVEGTIAPLIIDLSLPSEALTFVIDPNQKKPEKQFVSPTFELENNSNAALKVSVRSFQSLNGLFQDVMPDFYKDWSGLTKTQSRKLALSLVTSSQPGWLSLENERYYAAEKDSKVLGVINPKETVSFTFEAKHGTSFPDSEKPMYQLSFLFELNQ